MLLHMARFSSFYGWIIFHYTYTWGRKESDTTERLNWTDTHTHTHTHTHRYVYNAWCKIVVQFYSFTCGYGCLGFPAPLSPTAYLWLICYKIMCHMCVDLFLGSILYSIDLGVCFYLLFWWVYICNILRNQGTCYLQLWAFFSKLLSLFGIFCSSIQIWGLFVLFLWKMPLGFGIALKLEIAVGI